jgi:hypothetical protein
VKEEVDPLKAVERIAEAIKDRNPDGYTEVLAVDVCALKELIDHERNNGVPDALVKGAKRALGKIAPELVTVHQRTDQLAQLLGALKSAEPVR